MKNSKTLALLKPAIVLTLICIVSAALLATVNKFTGPEIGRREDQQLNDTFLAVLPDAKDAGFEEIKVENAPASVKQVCKAKNGAGYALLMTAQSGYHTLEFSIGIDSEGKIAGVSMISPIHSGGNAAFGESLPIFLDSYKGVGKDLEGSVDKVTNATKSSIAMRAAMADAFALVERLKGGA